MLFKNATGQKVHIYAYDSTTGAPKTGDAANITGYVSLDGTANAIDDTNPAEVDATNLPGIYCFDLTQAETNCNSLALYAKSSTANIRIEPLIGFTTAGAVPGAVAGANGGLATTNGTKLNQTVDLTAGQSIACSDKTGFSLSATGADLILKTSTFVQAIVAAVNEFATYGLTALNTLLVTTGIKAATLTTLPATAATAAELAKVPKSDAAVSWNATALAAIADALLDRVDGIETGLTFRQAQRLAVAALAGKLSGAATTTVTIRNAVGDSKNRIVATVDSDGNRTAITTDLT